MGNFFTLESTPTSHIVRKDARIFTPLLHTEERLHTVKSFTRKSYPFAQKLLIAPIKIETNYTTPQLPPILKVILMTKPQMPLQQYDTYTGRNAAALLILALK